MFISEFAPAVIDATVASAKRFGSAVQYLESVQAKAKEELRQCEVASRQGSAYAKQFLPARAAEAYGAFNHCADLLALLEVAE